MGPCELGGQAHAATTVKVTPTSLNPPCTSDVEFLTPSGSAMPLSGSSLWASPTRSLCACVDARLGHAACRT